MTDVQIVSRKKSAKDMVVKRNEEGDERALGVYCVGGLFLRLRQVRSGRYASEMPQVWRSFHDL